MIKRKVAMLGAFAVGKTSLVRRFVSGIFSDRYLTTVGVRIDKRELVVQGAPTTLLLWDLQGEDEAHRVNLAHLRGSSGFLLVADGTRRHTLDTALRLRDEALAMLGPVPWLLLVNKNDQRERWEIPPERLQELAAAGCVAHETSALLGEGVEDAFAALAAAMHAR
jgi:small GTP-binding protein